MRNSRHVKDRTSLSTLENPRKREDSQSHKTADKHRFKPEGFCDFSSELAQRLHSKEVRSSLAEELRSKRGTREYNESRSYIVYIRRFIYTQTDI